MKVCETIQFVNSKFTIYCEVKIFARHFGKILGLLQPFSWRDHLCRKSNSGQILIKKHTRWKCSIFLKNQWHLDRMCILIVETQWNEICFWNFSKFPDFPNFQIFWPFWPKFHDREIKIRAQNLLISKA